MAREVDKGRYKKAKSAREVSISQTSWKKDTGAGPKGKAGRLTGPGGKLFTGTVKMEDGSKAVYEKGKRVSRRTTEGGGVTKAQASSSRKVQSGSSAPKSTTKKAASPTKKSTSPQSTMRPSGEEGPKRSVKRVPSSGGQTLQIPGGISVKLGGGSSKPAAKKTSGPKVGTRRRSGAYGGYEVWTGSRWVKERKK